MSRRPRQPFWEQELLRYGEGVHALASPATPAALAAAERRRGAPLAPGHRALLALHDGGTLFHEAYRLRAAAEIADDRIGEEGEGDLALDPDGRVVRVEAGGAERLVVGTSLARWLDAVFAREGLVYDADGEFRDVFEADAPELRREVMIARERKAIARDPGAPAWHFELGRLLGASDRAREREEAARELARAAELDPHLHWAPFELGRVLRALDRRAEAVEAFLRAAAASPPDGPLFFAWAARVAGEAGDAPLAARLRARVKLLDPGFAGRNRDLGRRLLDEGDAAAAAEQLALAFAVDHHDADTRALLERALASASAAATSAT